MHRVPFILCLLAIVPLISAAPADVEKEFPTADGKKLEVIPVQPGSGAP